MASEPVSKKLINKKPKAMYLFEMQNIKPLTCYLSEYLDDRYTGPHNSIIFASNPILNLAQDMLRAINGPKSKRAISVGA